MSVKKVDLSIGNPLPPNAKGNGIKVSTFNISPLEQSGYDWTIVGVLWNTWPYIEVQSIQALREYPIFTVEIAEMMLSYNNVNSVPGTTKLEKQSESNNWQVLVQPSTGVSWNKSNFVNRLFVPKQLYGIVSKIGGVIGVSKVEQSRGSCLKEKE